MSIYGPISTSQFGLITLCILCHQEALVSSFPPSKEENIRAWCAFPIQDMPEVVKKKVTSNNDSLIVQRVGYLLGNYSKQIHTQTRVQNEYFYNQRTSSLREERYFLNPNFKSGNMFIFDLCDSLKNLFDPFLQDLENSAPLAFVLYFAEQPNLLQFLDRNSNHKQAQHV